MCCAQLCLLLRKCLRPSQVLDGGPLYLMVRVPYLIGWHICSLAIGVLSEQYFWSFYCVCVYA